MRTVYLNDHPRFSPQWVSPGHRNILGREIPLRSGLHLTRISLARCPRRRRCPPQTCQQCVWRHKASRDISSIGTVVNSDSWTAAPAALGSDPDQLPIIISDRIRARDLGSASGELARCGAPWFSRTCAARRRLRRLAVLQRSLLRSHLLTSVPSNS